MIGGTNLSGFHPSSLLFFLFLPPEASPLPLMCSSLSRLSLSPTHISCGEEGRRRRPIPQRGRVELPRPWPASAGFRPPAGAGPSGTEGRREQARLVRQEQPALAWWGPIGDRGEATGAALEQRGRGGAGAAPSGQPAVEVRRCGAAPLPRFGGVGALPQDSVVELPLFHSQAAEIGRASCRERVFEAV